MAHTVGQISLTKLDPALERGLPFAQYQYVDVTFNATANVDTDIRHTLTTADPYAVRYLPINWQFGAAPAAAPGAYIDTSGSRKAWGAGYIVLRCNVAAAKARLLLFLER